MKIFALCLVLDKVRRQANKPTQAEHNRPQAPQNPIQAPQKPDFLQVEQDRTGPQDRPQAGSDRPQEGRHKETPPTPDRASQALDPRQNSRHIFEKKFPCCKKYLEKSGIGLGNHGENTFAYQEYLGNGV